MDSAISWIQPAFSVTYDLRCLADVLPIYLASLDPQIVLVATEMRDEAMGAQEHMAGSPPGITGKRAACCRGSWLTVPQAM
jgi:hypothetical protein